MKKLILIVLVALLMAMLISCHSDEVNKNIEGVKMTAIIKNLEDKIEVEVIEGEYGASGIYWLNTSSDTVFVDESNNNIRFSELKIGDVIEITYDGKVMLSYPPQIVALKIQKIK